MESVQIHSVFTYDLPLLLLGKIADSFCQFPQRVCVSFSVRVIRTPDQPVGAQHLCSEGEGLFVRLT